MGLVETIRKKPAVGATIGSVCLLTALIVLYSTQVGPSRFSPPKLFYFSDDDGKTFFADDANKVPPFDKDGKHLGTIPASRNLVSVTIGGPQRKTLYSVTAAVVNGERKVWIESIPLLATGPTGRGK